MHRRLLALATCVLALLAAPGCDVKVGEKGGVSLDIGGGKASDEWTRSYPIDAGGKLEIVNVNGSIEVSRSAGNTVEIKAVREARAGSDEASQALLKTQPKLEEQASPGQVRVSVEELPNAEGQRGGARTSVEFSVSIPDGLTATFRTRNGHVRLEGVNGRFDASTTNGRVGGRGVSGSLQASTVNGEIDVAMASVTGDVLLHGVNGGISLDLLTTVDADLQLTTVNGFVGVDDGFKMTGLDRNGRTRLAGRINKGGPKVVAETTNGRVHAEASVGPPFGKK